MKENVFIAGHRGMVGSAVYNQLKNNDRFNLITASSEELDLRNKEAVFSFFDRFNIDHVILCAAKVGGILANNTYRSDFINDNLQIGLNVINACFNYKVNKLINLGSSCIYPKEASIPIKEEDLLSGKLESTNEPYAIAKIATLKSCEAFYHQHKSNFYSLMPCNLYGENDNFELQSSHVLPALINKFHMAKESQSDSVELWGSGKPMREFLYVQDLAKVIEYCLININAEDIYSKGISHLNCGSNEEVSILELAYIIKNTVDYHGEIVFDASKPDGTFRKKMDNSKLFSFYKDSQTSLQEGIAKTYSWFKKNI